WNPQQALLPYVTALALADVIVVTGESEAMLAEVAATDKVMVIYPLPRKSRT
ncbi:MAG: mitochondrial fission ELM1 family protein, partial [Nitrospira sp.]|nr:mitochondrial fission ELM1 family protein [Nitrospira sp.]